MSCKIKVENLQKVFRVPVREHGLLPAVKSVISPRYNEVKAVDDISFNIAVGEIVGFIGPNGAGKTTTLKVLSGLLHPTSGNVSVDGFKPWERKTQYLKKISMLMGNKTQTMMWNNTVYDSFNIYREIYNVPANTFKKKLNELIQLFEVEGILQKQSRNLSLGERSKCEFIAALIHSPGILYLDEPTLGMDVTIQLRLRKFIREYNQRYGTTVILTSHYMSDITSLCPRVVLIHKGRLLFEGGLEMLAEKIAPYKLVKLAFGEGEAFEPKEPLFQMNIDTNIVEQDGQNLTLRVRKEDAVAVTKHFMSNFRLADLSIQDPPIEAVIDRVYREGVTA
jgi:ABC-2 type transport system ATP-binding protein